MNAGFRAFGVVVSLAVLFASFHSNAATLERGMVDVLVAEDVPPVVRFAADEMTNFLSQVLGAEVPIVREPQAGRGCVVLGDNRWSRAEGLSVSGLPRDAFIEKSTADRVYLLGRDDPARNIYGELEIGGKGARTMIFERATVFAVYDFLERHADCRFFFPGEIGTDVPEGGTDNEKNIVRPAHAAPAGRLFLRPGGGGTASPAVRGLLLRPPGGRNGGNLVLQRGG